MSAAVLWLGPAVALRDGPISAGLVWFAALIGALWAGAVTFGFAMTAIAALGAWQAAGVVGDADAARPSRSDDSRASAAPRLPRTHRLPAAALAGAVGLAGVIDTRLTGAVVGAAVAASFLVAAALRPRRAASAARSTPAASLPVVAAAGLLIRAWVQVGVAAACAAAVARHSRGAALVLVCAAVAYDAAAHLTASGRPPGLRGPLAGAAAAVIAVFALTGLSVPPFAPADVIRFGVLAALTLPLGPALARPITVLGARPGRRLASEPGGTSPSAGERDAAAPADPFQRTLRRLAGEWAVRRLDSLSVAALAWLWGLGLLAV